MDTGLHKRVLVGCLKQPVLHHIFIPDQGFHGSNLGSRWGLICSPSFRFIHSCESSLHTTQTLLIDEINLNDNA